MAEKKEQEKTTNQGSSSLEPNVAALLAYLFGFVGGLIFYLIEKENKFIRFAAMQSILLNVVGFAVYFLLIVLTGIFAVATGGFGAFFGLLVPVFWIAYIIVWIMAMVKAYQNEEWELPVIGKIARNIVEKS